MSTELPRIGAHHVVCAIGNGTEQVWASARAGIARIGSSHVMDRHFDPIQMGLVPEDALPPLHEDIDKLPLPSRARRMLRLAAPSLEAVSAGLTSPVPLILAMPALAPESAGWVRHVPAYLQKLTRAAIDRDRSMVLPFGRAAGLLALEHALQQLASGEQDTVIVGGVDTFLDLRLLSELDGEGRILGSRVMDGFIPGEGAAFYVLSSAAQPAASGEPAIVVHGAASAMDPGHRYGDAPAKGEGLAVALAQLRQRMPPLPGPVATTFGGFNGESFDAKMWGVTYLRHKDLFAPAMAIEHPADKFGDAGAAMGAILVALAAESLSKGTRRGPALVWAASDREPRGCAIVSIAS
jgi:3-oxoacyl-[acyl-carrier-protein] synthase-1